MRFIHGEDDIDTVRAIRDNIIKGVFTESNGMVVVSWSSNDVTVTKQFAISTSELLDACTRFIEEYNAGGGRIRRLSPRYI